MAKMTPAERASVQAAKKENGIMKSKLVDNGKNFMTQEKMTMSVHL